MWVGLMMSTHMRTYPENLVKICPVHSDIIVLEMTDDIEYSDIIY